MHMTVMAQTLRMLVRVEAANKAWLQPAASVVTRMISAGLGRARDRCDVHIFLCWRLVHVHSEAARRKSWSPRDCVCIAVTPWWRDFFLCRRLVDVHSEAAHRTRLHRFDVTGFYMRVTCLLGLLMGNELGLFANVAWCMPSVTNATCAMEPFRASVFASL